MRSRQTCAAMRRRRKKQLFIRRVLYISIISIFMLVFCVFMSDDSVDAHSTNEEYTGNEIPSGNKYYTCIEVSSGDSLWSIAEKYADSDYETIHDYIDELKAINSLRSSNIHAGQYLTVPYYERE